MRSFACDTCGQAVFFENSWCLSCGSTLGYLPVERRVGVLAPGVVWCVNHELNGCTWVPAYAGEACAACVFTRTRPADDDLVGLPQYVLAEQAKRRLLHELAVLGLPVLPRVEATGTGLAFDLLSSVDEDVVIGHADGVITIDVAESDDAHRARVQAEMGEPYRTMLGHFRHEIGHYFEAVLVDGTPWVEPTRALFGDETVDYAAAIEQHYADGPPADWQRSYVSAYATMHPWEDFAETFAHVLHIRDTLDTAHSYGLIPDPHVRWRPFEEVVSETWLPLTLALNEVNRSMGADDLYPFALAPGVVAKLAHVHSIVAASSIHAS